VAGLSGGERRRLSLAILVSSGANFLIIDEPTNHLDLESREALEDALRAFDGTVLLVSHDRALLDAVGTRTLAIEERKLASHLGGWADYVRLRDERKAAEAAPATPPKAKKEKPPAPAALSKNRAKRIADLEREVAQAEAALKQLEDELADPAAWASPTGSQRSAKRHADARHRVDELYEELLALSED
jgi:ATP-binding cassette, subfamily F, member 3